jgi:threonine dehydrogenase-like Zn-dependent dehydrogenase
VRAVKELAGGIGADRVIDAVGIDAQRPKTGPAAGESQRLAGQFEAEQRRAAPRTSPHDAQWVPGDAPSQALRWAVHAVAKASRCRAMGDRPGESGAPDG